MKWLCLFLFIGLVLVGCANIQSELLGQKESREAADEMGLLRKNMGREATDTNRAAMARFLLDGMDMNVTLVRMANRGFCILPDEQSLRISENKEITKIGNFVMGSLRGRGIFLLMPFGPELVFQAPESDMSMAVITRSLLNSEDVDVTLMVHNNAELYPYFLNSYSILLNNQSPLPVVGRGYDNLGRFKLKIDQQQVAFLLIPS